MIGQQIPPVTRRVRKSGGRSRVGRATRQALLATPLLILIGWLSPQIYGYEVTLPRALCVIVGLGLSEAAVDENWPPLQRELAILAIGVAISFGLAGLIEMEWPGSM